MPRRGMARASTNGSCVVSIRPTDALQCSKETFWKYFAMRRGSCRGKLLYTCVEACVVASLTASSTHATRHASPFLHMRRRMCTGAIQAQM